MLKAKNMLVCLKVIFKQQYLFSSMNIIFMIFFCKNKIMLFNSQQYK